MNFPAGGARPATGSNTRRWRRSLCPSTRFLARHASAARSIAKAAMGQRQEMGAHCGGEPAGAKDGYRFCRYAYREPAARPISMVLIVGKLPLHARQSCSSNFPESADPGRRSSRRAWGSPAWRLRPDRCQLINAEAIGRPPKRAPAEQVQIVSMGWSVRRQPVARAGPLPRRSVEQPAQLWITAAVACHGSRPLTVARARGKARLARPWLAPAAWRVIHA